ncbi:MAG TPA: septal ring lytic transglycosylase RlpA family protein [Burkholderiales bacterium]|nr:septal ring lytic transglycosylase RlpA family protein [Burkholderiales bacterium]
MSATLLLAALGGCGTMAPRDETPPPTTEAKAPPSPPPSRRGGYYLDDGPGDNPPANLESIPDAVPKVEALHRAAARPYVAMGRNYTPMTAVAPYKARGLATWYGRRYHGKPTSTGEIYDMYAMTAAHPTLPLPSYVRVTNPANGKTVVVRVNDRGPFVEGRLIDLSYTAAYKLGTLGGATLVEVESIVPAGSGTIVVAAPPVSSQYGQSTGAASAAPAPVTPRPPVNADGGFSVIPAAAAEPLPAATQLPVTTDGGRIYLQVGAFGSRENAESYLARLKAQAEWLTLQVFPRDGLFRVQAGPYLDQNEARQIADRLGQALGVKSIVLIR